MYGTVARLQVRPGGFGALQEMNRAEELPQIPGFVFQHIYRLDADPNTFILVVAFESKEAYLANATSPEQAARYEQYRAQLTADPEWSDGEIVQSYPG